MIIVITGPTGVGKTKVSIELAKKLNGEIINCDSTQVYKKLDIATAKIKENEKENIVHHLIDIKNIEENYTVFDFQKDCRLKLEEIKSKGKNCILVGGTGLYIKAALYDYQFSDECIDKEYSDNTEILYKKLLEVDPNTDIHKNNRKRIIRALNYYEKTNKAFSEKGKTDKLLYDVIFIGLKTNRETLYSRIDRRVDLMVEEGLIEEALKIYKTNIRTKAVMTPIGYKELFSYFENNSSKEDCINKIKQKSRNYAKKQFTWFNHQMDINWIDVNLDDFNETINDTLQIIKKYSK